MLTTEDTRVERDETFYVYITESTGDLSYSGLPSRYLARAAGTILDDDETGEAAPVPRIADVSAEEGEALEFTVTLRRTPSDTVTFYYATYRGTAGRDDYAGHFATALRFGSGERSQTITIRTTEDTEVEDDETFYVYVADSADDLTASVPVRYLARAAGTIRDDEVLDRPTFRDCAECPEMVVVPAGRYRMGLSFAEAVGLGADGFYATPDHVVTIAESFAVGAHEVTRREWSVFVSEGGDRGNFYCFTPPRYDTRTIGLVWNEDARWDRPGFEQNDAHPAVCVSWQDARDYVEWLSDRTGEDYRLLSESEWEYAARGGRSTSSRHWYEHSSQACVHANARDRSTNEAYPMWAGPPFHDCRDGHVYTAPVASFAPNGYGLYDMLGNAREWTEDCWSPGYYGAPADGSARGGCSVTFGRRVIRGGSWYGKPGEVQLWYRDDLAGDAHFANLGFRVARTLD